MNFKPNKKKLKWSVLISFFATLLSMYLAYPAVIQNTKIVEVIELKTAGAGAVFYLACFFVIIYISLLVVFYIAWSLFEE